MILSPSNDFVATIFLEDVDGVTFAPVPLTSGVVSAFISTSNDPLATSIDPTLIVGVVHVGVAAPAADQYPLGTWGVVFPADILTPALLDPFFKDGGNTPYVIVVVSGGARVYQQLKYVRTRAASN